MLYEMNVRQLTPEGTLKAAEAKLEFLRSIGIDAVWLMPIYPIGKEQRKGSLGSYYSIADYCAVNPEFGSMADFDSFVAKAHALGIKVLIDWVANHTSRDAVWLRTKPADWYEREADGAAKVPWDWTDTTIRIAPCGAARSKPCAFGSNGTTSTDSAATWPCSCL